jgi:hypothetical protein
MNALILTAPAAAALIAAQHGQHRLAPVALTDGRFFLAADVLDEPLYAGRLDNVEYTLAPLASAIALLPVSDGGEGDP